MMPLVRKADVDDIGAIMEVMDQAFDPAFGEAWTREQCLSAFSLPGTTSALALTDGQVSGFALWRTILEECELFLIGIDPSRQRQGIGKALVDYVSLRSAQDGAKRVYVEVRSDNPARRFYTKLGFEQVGIRQNYYRRKDNGPTDALSLVAHLVVKS